jgi:hypothetical protein
MQTPETVVQLIKFVKDECGLVIQVFEPSAKPGGLKRIHGSTRLCSLDEFNRAEKPFRLPALRAEMTVEEAESAFQAAWGLRVEILLLRKGSKTRRVRRAKDMHPIGSESIGFRLNGGGRRKTDGPPRAPRVFISYRREGGSELAQLVCQFLEDKGVPTFLDVESLGAGRFAAQIRDEIEQSTHVVVVCTPGALDPRPGVEDWVHAELELALQHRSILIPFLSARFEWPERARLPRGLQDLPEFQGFQYSHESWRSSRDRFLAMIVPRSEEAAGAPPDGGTAPS